MAIQVFSGDVWHVAIGSATEVAAFMGTGSVTPVMLKAIVSETAGSIAVFYHK